MATKYDTNSQTGLVPGVLRHDVVAPAPVSHGVDRTSEAWKAAYQAARRGEKADRAQPAPKSKDAPDSITAITDGLFKKSWQNHATIEGENQ